MLVLGLDPGLATTGYGLVEYHSGAFSSVACGIIQTPVAMPFAERLVSIHDRLRELIQEYQPEAAAVEQLFFAKNTKTALAVAHARGVLLFTLAELSIPYEEYTPRVVKQGITGSGAAQKAQVQEMIMRLLRLASIPKPDDAADALAIAVCHLQNAPIRAAMQRAEK